MCVEILGVLVALVAEVALLVKVAWSIGSGGEILGVAALQEILVSEGDKKRSISWSSARNTSIL